MSAEVLVLRRLGSFWYGLLRGLSCPIELFGSPSVRLPYRSDAEALRKDWENIGGDFSAAMTHEREALAGNR